MGFVDHMTAELTEIARLVPVPPTPYGYGRDLSCRYDLTATLAETDPESVDGIAESILRRLQTPPGWLDQIGDNPNYGCDVIGLLNAGVTPVDLRAKEAEIKADCMSDDRIASLTVSVLSSDDRTIDIRMFVEPRSPALATFTLTFAATDSAVLIREVK